MASELIVQTLKGPTSGANANKILIPSGQTLNAAGHVVSVHKAFSNTEQTINSTSLTNITDLSITMTPKDANNLLILQSVVSVNLNHVFSLTFLKDGSKTTTTSGTNSNEADTHSTFYLNNSGFILGHPLMHYETAGDTNSRTYTVAGTGGWSGTAYSHIINDRNGSDMGATSWFLLMEIAQ